MRIAVIGAGPAGLTSAKQALARGHDVILYEKCDDLGGIWNPKSGGAYAGVRMQSSRMSFHFSDFAPDLVSDFGADFPSSALVHRYFQCYARAFGVSRVIRYEQLVRRVRKRNGQWEVTASHRGRKATDQFDAVMVATGELWKPKTPARIPRPHTGVRVLTVKDYRRPEEFRGQRVLVVGGGVSGADIAAELVGEAAAIEWSVRRPALFLPRDIDDVFNDALFSYIGRVAVTELAYSSYLEWLETLLPEYMRMYRATGLLPATGFHNAVHVNERIVPHVYRREVRVRPPFRSFARDGSVVFTDGTRAHYDSVLLCLGYEMPDYGFIDRFRQTELYEHFFYIHDPTLAIINTPVDAEGFGTACPYFEAIARWALSVFDGETMLPSKAAMAAWCERHLGRLADKRFYDCWLETIRIGLTTRTLPDPHTGFAEYWRLVSSIVTPSNLRSTGVADRPAEHDGLFDMGALKCRVLAALPRETRDALFHSGQISEADHRGSLQVPAGREIAPWLPYEGRLPQPGGWQDAVRPVRGLLRSHSALANGLWSRRTG